MSGRRDPAAEREADRQARLAAQTVFDRPLALEAGAGTGKTATLVARIATWALGPGWERAAEEESEALRRERPGQAPTPERVAARCLGGVVAITFTEAAAAEMAARVGEALAGVARDEPPPWLAPSALPADAALRRQRATELLVALDHLAVSTIHAFCRRLLARWPLEAGLHPSFTVDAEERVLERVVQESVEAAIRRAFDDGTHADHLLLARRGIGLERVAEAVTALARAGVPAAAIAAEAFTGAGVATLVARVHEGVAALAALIAPRIGGSRKARNAAALAGALQALAQRLERNDAIAVDALRDAVGEALAENLVGHLKKWCKGELNGEERERLGEVRSEVRARSASLVDLIEFLGAIDMELLGHAQRVVAPLLSTVQQELRRRGAQTFAALLRDARDLLARNPMVATRERREIRQLLVDEFQDTDATQCEMLRTLVLAGPPAGRPCLFLVGDPKQSIYGWRSADLAAYERFLADLLAAGGESYKLSVNFRSVPVILDEVTRCVEPVMKARPGVQPAFQELLPCEAKIAERGFSGGARAPVEFWVSWASPEGDDGGSATSSAEAAELEAKALARDIRAIHDKGGVAWAEVGVLLRTFSDADTYLHALRVAGVPYAVERDRSYYRRREIIEAAALVRTILDPADHLALVTWLRSLAVGTPDAALLPLWEEGFPGLMTELAGAADARLERVRSLAASVARAIPPEVPGIDRIAGWERALVAGIEAVAELREAFARDSAPVFVERLRNLTLVEAGEAARMLGAYRVANLDRFFRELAAAIEESGRDPEAVLRALRVAVAERREAEEGRPREAAQDAVQVMTIHKAKGLDFGHVYLVQTHKRSGPGTEQAAEAEMIGGSFEWCLFAAPTPGWIAVEERRRSVAEAELVRTLYVALTRARDRLVVAGRWPSSAGEEAPAASHMALLRQRADGLDLGALQAQGVADGSGFADSGNARWVFPPAAQDRAEERELPAGGRLPSPEEAEAGRVLFDTLRVAAEARMARPISAPATDEAHRALRELLDREHGEEEPGVPGSARPLRRDAAVAAGSAVHRALELIDLRADIGGELARQRERLAADLAGAGVGSAEAEAMRRAETIIARLAASRMAARFAEIAPGIVARELPVLLPPGDDPGAPVGFVAGTIDVVYRDPSSGELVIADYKTDDVQGDAEVAARAALYASQGAVYQRALQEALGLPAPPRFELWFVQADRIVAPRV